VASSAGDVVKKLEAQNAALQTKLNETEAKLAKVLEAIR